MRAAHAVVPIVNAVLRAFLHTCATFSWLIDIWHFKHVSAQKCFRMACTWTLISSLLQLLRIGLLPYCLHVSRNLNIVVVAHVDQLAALRTLNAPGLSNVLEAFAHYRKARCNQLGCAPKIFSTWTQMKNGCGSSVTENIASVSKKAHGVSFAVGEASMRARVYSQSARSVLLQPTNFARFCPLYARNIYRAGGLYSQDTGHPTSSTLWVLQCRPPQNFSLRSSK